MNTDTQKLGENKAKINITIDYDDFLKYEDVAFNKQKSKMSIPGFRKGKVTKEMAYKVYGREAFLEDAANECINATYYDAIKDVDVHIISSPKIEIVELDIKEKKPFVYSVEVAIIPDVKITDYKGVKIKKSEAKVSDDEINNVIKQEQDKNARVVAVDRKSKMGDMLDIDFDGFIDGKPFEGGSMKHYSITLGTKTFIDTFEDQMVGYGAGDDVEVHVKFPEDYGHKHLAGKPAEFKVHIHEVKEKQLPDIDDEFVSEISEFEKLSDYKADIKKKLLEVKEAKNKDEDKNNIVNEIAKRTTINIADEAIDTSVKDMVKDQRNRLKYQGLELEQYLQMLGKTMEEYEKDLRPQAEKTLKNSIILEKIAEQEKLEAPEEMVEEDIANMAKSCSMDVEVFKKTYVTDEQRKRLKDDLLYPTVLNFLYDNAKFE